MDRKLGMLGLDSKSTCFYLDKLNEVYREKKGGYSTCPLVLVNADFNNINPFLPNDFKGLRAYLTEKIIELTGLGVKRILVPNITLHHALEDLGLDDLVVNPLRLAARKLSAEGDKEVFIFGTRFTMKSDYIKQIFRSEGIEVFAPDTEDFELIEEFRKNIYDGEESGKDEQQYINCVMKNSQTMSVLSACTELSRYYIQELGGFYDLSHIQIEDAVSWVLEKSN